MLEIINIVAVATIITVVSYLYMRIQNITKSSDAMNTRIGGLNTSLDEGLKKVGTRIEQGISNVQKDVKDNVTRLDSVDSQIMNTNASSQQAMQQAMQQALSSTDAKQQELQRSFLTTDSRQQQLTNAVTSVDTKHAELQKALSTTQAELAKVDVRKGGKITGDIDVSGTTKTSTIKLGDKWSMSGVGDSHGNDDWLRFFDKDGKDYYGGVAAGKLWSKGGIQVGGDVVMEGTNKWILHTPDDGRKTMFIAPANDKGEWMWDKQVRLENDGTVAVNKLLSAGDIVMEGSNSWVLHTPDDGRKILYIAPSDEKGGWKWDKQVSFDQDGNMTVNGNVSLQDKQLRLRGLGDPNHYVGWSGAVDGPRIQGFVGGQLGTNHTGDKTALQWNQGGVNIPEKLCVGPTDNNWCFVPDPNGQYLNIVRNNAKDEPDQAFFKLTQDGNMWINRNVNRGWVAEGMRR
jgi:uncharacterized protein YoxC